MNKLSIIIPAYNEEATISKILARIDKVKISLNKEYIIVNDGSKDDTIGRIKQFMKDHKNVKLINKPNGGKGSAIIEGLKHSTGDIIIPQDADLEYDPRDYKQIIRPIIDGKAKVVYGSRHLRPHKRSYLLAHVGGKIITLVANILYGTAMTDEPTCYKAISREVADKLKLECKGFDFCPEITAKISKLGYEILEVPISYRPRSFEEGKKINWRDGFIALWTLFKYRFKK